MRSDTSGGDRSARTRHLQQLLLLAPFVVALPAGAVTLTRGPYLQLLATDGVTVVWNTDSAASCGVAVRALDGPARVVAKGGGPACAIRVDGLRPGSEYAYTPLADGAALREESLFRTDDPARPFAFLVFGDSGTGSAEQLALRDRMLRTSADLILHTGDMVYETGAAADFDPKFFKPYEALLRHLVLWPCLGNHDIKEDNALSWRDAFHTPANNPAGNESHYSFDVGNAHVVVLNSNAATAPGSPQYLFLDRDLGASRVPWKFVVFHHTIYSSGVHGGAATVRTNLVPLFDKHGVDVVFMGHDHHYERTKPLRANRIVDAGLGTVYVTTGGGGGEIRPVGTSAFTAYAEAGVHFVRVLVDGGVLQGEMIRMDGTVADAFALAKGAPLPVPRCGDDLVNQPAERCDGADQPACAGGCRADCTCVPVCGDGEVNQPGEACDGSADGACPGACLADCRCGRSAPVLELAPVADTYVEAGETAGWDHGAGDHLDVDLRPPGIAYLKFDLSPVSALIRRATLTLHCMNPTADGGRVYPVGDSTWIEGNRTGVTSTSARGPGLKWTDVDTNDDDTIDTGDDSPWVPDFSRPVASFGTVVSGRTTSVDVTAVFQEGPGVYTLAIANDSTDGAGYVSREADDVAARPRLRLEIEPRCEPDGCNDDNPCTDDGCDPAQGCVHLATAAVCDDGSACTTADTCADGTCVGGPPPGCDDGNGCTDDGCDPLGGCRHAPNAAPCSDGDTCTLDDGCVAGACAAGPPRDCDDANPCTDDACDPARGCLHASNAAPCDDDNACTAGDACTDGTCGGGPALACDDANPCTADQCDPETGCTHAPAEASCDDGDACTLDDGCVAGRCAGTPRDCDDQNACTDDACDAGACVHTANAASCDDGNACTFSDGCADGACAGSPSCGNDVLDAGCGEACDGAADAACPGFCRADCACGAGEPE